MTVEIGHLRRATIEVTYVSHGGREPDWEYHLRLGEADIEDVLTVSDRPLRSFEATP